MSLKLISLLNCLPGHLCALCAAALSARVEAEDLAAEDALRLPVAQTAPLHHLHALDQPPAMYISNFAQESKHHSLLHWMIAR